MSTWAIGSLERLQEFGSDIEAIRLTWTQIGVLNCIKFSELPDSMQDSIIKWINE